MSTVITLHPGVVNKTISNTVKALAAGQGITVEEAGRRAGIARGTMFRRIKGENSWTAEEVAQLASVLDATVRDLYSGMDGRFVPDHDGPEDGGPLAQSAELRTFNPSSEGVVLPFARIAA